MDNNGTLKEPFIFYSKFSKVASRKSPKGPSTRGDCSPKMDLMCTRLCIQLSSFERSTRVEWEFLQDDVWTEEAEGSLLQRVKEVLSLLRRDGRSLELHLVLEVADPGEALFLIKKRLRYPLSSPLNPAKLSLREVEVLQLIIRGFTNTEIAGKLSVSYETVKSHRRNLLAKTGARNTAALIHYYHRTFSEK